MLAVRLAGRAKKDKSALLGLDSLQPQAYNPPPLSRYRGSRADTARQVFRGRKIKSKKMILGVDSLQPQAYNPPPLP